MHEDELLVLASDGLWDVFSCQETTTLTACFTVAAAAASARPVAQVTSLQRTQEDELLILASCLR
jgi:serine/threonine protein phosphatase PrpC